MSAACTTEPVSQLRLERYVLAELPDAEHARVEAHLAGCPACRQCLDELRASEPVLRPLPAATLQLNELPPAAQKIVLPTRLARERGAAGPPRSRAPRVSAARVWRVAGGLALAAALMLALRAGLQGPPLDGGEQTGRDSGRAVKGGEIALQLVRERGGDVARDPRTFSHGDRFAALVTCPPSSVTGVHWDLVVFQVGEAFFPLTATDTLRCGNAVSLPGAFALTGSSPARVCVALAASPLDRDALRRGEGTLPEQHACTTVSPEAR
jgi:hypothetical protein